MNTQPLRVVVSGAGGQMGQALVKVLAHADKASCIGALGRMVVTTSILPVMTDLADLDAPDVVIDFSRPEFAMSVAQQCVHYKVPLVSGTTGLGNSELYQLEAMGQEIPLLWEANMSLGVNLMMELARLLSGVLGEDYDVEISEAHHRNKVDTPSGTALRFGEAVAAGRGERLEDLAIYDRSPLHQVRQPGSIGFSSIRAGDIVGEHEILFAGPGEQITLGHRSSNRKTFAQGALRAARWLVTQPAGFHQMRDVFSLNERLSGHYRQS